MKKPHIFWILIFILFIPSITCADAPHGIAGFVLESNINKYKALIKPETDLPMRHLESIYEVEIQRIPPGFKTGLLTYATCAEAGRILKIKLKYADFSNKFYKKLLKSFKERFGEPTEWRGDPFHIVIAWKWSFTDKDNNKISLHLQHNTKDVEEKIGNSVKLSMTSAIEAERRCFEEKNPRNRGKKKMGRSDQAAVDWERFIPR